MKALFLATFPEDAACTRYRCSQYFDYLRSHGIDCTLKPLLAPEVFRTLYRRGGYAPKIARIAAATLRRVADLAASRSFDVVCIQREAALFGPPAFEWLLVRALRRKVVFDFDDAVFVPYTSPTYGRWATWVKCAWKTATIIQLSRHVIAGNDFLAEYARKMNSNVSVIPTVVDLEAYRFASRDPRAVPTIGWIGSPTTTQYLKPLIPILEELATQEKFAFKIVGASERFSLARAATVNEAWRLDRETADFGSLDIGVFPITEDAWSVGKCGFKAIQYMAAGAVCVASPVGVNRDIVRDGENGMLAATREEWVEKLTTLLRQPDLRRRLAQAGRQTVEERFSLQVHAPRFLAILKSVAEERRQ